MASHRLAAVLRSTGQLPEEDIDNMREDAAWQWLRANEAALRQADKETRSAVGTPVVKGKLLC